MSISIPYSTKVFIFFYLSMSDKRSYVPGCKQTREPGPFNMNQVYCIRIPPGVITPTASSLNDIQGINKGSSGNITVTTNLAAAVRFFLSMCGELGEADAAVWIEPVHMDKFETMYRLWIVMDTSQVPHTFDRRICETVNKGYMSEIQNSGAYPNGTQKTKQTTPCLQSEPRIYTNMRDLGSGIYYLSHKSIGATVKLDPTDPVNEYSPSSAFNAYDAFNPDVSCYYETDFSRALNKEQMNFHNYIMSMDHVKFSETICRNLIYVKHTFMKRSDAGKTLLPHIRPSIAQQMDLLNSLYVGTGQISLENKILKVVAHDSTYEFWKNSELIEDVSEEDEASAISVTRPELQHQINDPSYTAYVNDCYSIFDRMKPQIESEYTVDKLSTAEGFSSYVNTVVDGVLGCRDFEVQPHIRNMFKHLTNSVKDGKLPCHKKHFDLLPFSEMMATLMVYLEFIGTASCHDEFVTTMLTLLSGMFPTHEEKLISFYTGPPGSGKSTMVDLFEKYAMEGSCKRTSYASVASFSITDSQLTGVHRDNCKTILMDETPYSKMGMNGDDENGANAALKEIFSSGQISRNIVDSRSNTSDGLNKRILGDDTKRPVQCSMAWLCCGNDLPKDPAYLDRGIVVNFPGRPSSKGRGTADINTAMASCRHEMKKFGALFKIIQSAVCVLRYIVYTAPNRMYDPDETTILYYRMSVLTSLIKKSNQAELSNRADGSVTKIARVLTYTSAAYMAFCTNILPPTATLTQRLHFALRSLYLNRETILYAISYRMDSIAVQKLRRFVLMALRSCVSAHNVFMKKREDLDVLYFKVANNNIRPENLMSIILSMYKARYSKEQVVNELKSIQDTICSVSRHPQICYSETNKYERLISVNTFKSVFTDSDIFMAKIIYLQLFQDDDGEETKTESLLVVESWFKRTPYAKQLDVIFRLWTVIWPSEIQLVHASGTSNGPSSTRHTHDTTTFMSSDESEVHILQRTTKIQNIIFSRSFITTLQGSDSDIIRDTIRECGHKYTKPDNILLSYHVRATSKTPAIYGKLTCCQLVPNPSVIPSGHNPRYMDSLARQIVGVNETDSDPNLLETNMPTTANSIIFEDCPDKIVASSRAARIKFPMLSIEDIYSLHKEKQTLKSLRSYDTDFTMHDHRESAPNLVIGLKTKKFEKQQQRAISPQCMDEDDGSTITPAPSRPILPSLSARSKRKRQPQEYDECDSRLLVARELEELGIYSREKIPDYVSQDEYLE